MIAAGYMVPHPPIAVAEIGKGEEKKIGDTLSSFERVASDIAKIRPETIILTSPHAVMYQDYFHISPGGGATGSLGQFGAGQVRFKEHYDKALASEIERDAASQGFPAGFLGERDPALDHGTMVPLYFVEKEYRDFELIRIGLSGLSLEDHWKLGEIIRSATGRSEKKCVFIASGDLSHCQKGDGPYGYRPEGPEYDRMVMDVMGSGDFRRLLSFDEGFLSKSMECGHRSFAIMGGALCGGGYKATRLSHEATFGVGYGFCMYHR